MDELLDLSQRGRLQGAIMAQMGTEEEAAAARAFLDALTDEQVQQLLALDGFTEEFKIPIWDDEIGRPARDANKQRDRKPDRYLDGRTAPRNIADDLVVLLVGASDLEEVESRLDTASKLDKTNKEYWRRLHEILMRNSLPSFGGKRVQKIVVPTDFTTHKIWDQQKEGNVTLRITSDIRGKKEVTTYVRINFDNLPDEIKKKLDYFDEQVYEAAANLWLAGNEYVSSSMIYGVHNDGRPGPEDIEKIDASLSKMTPTRIELSNEDEAKKTNYPLFKYDGSMLPMERSRCYINGKLVESAIHLFREPPFFSYAKSKGQITTVDRKLALSPLNKTEANIHLSKYILRIISAAKLGKITNKITYKTIYEELGITSPSQRTRTKGYTKRLFEFHKAQGNISSFKEEKDGIRFYWKTSGELQKN